MKKVPLQSIKSRILATNITFVLLSFFAVILIFNFFINQYISRATQEQLTNVVSYQTSNSPKQSSNQENENSAGTAQNLDNAPRGIFKTRAESFIIDKNYSVDIPENAPQQDQTTSKKIASTLKSQSINLSNLKNYKLSTGTGTFYLETNSLTDGDYLLIYVDITGILSFSSSVDLFLILIALIVVLLLTVALSVVTERLVRPLSGLSKFARRIGKGDFTPYTVPLYDKELEVLLDNMNAAAAQLNANDKDQKLFFQNVSHELRTPLMAIKSYAEGISYEVMESKEASKIILKETDRMSELVEDLLTLSRLDSLNVYQEEKEINLIEFLQEIVEEQTAMAQQRGLKFNFNFSGRPLLLRMNEKSLRRSVSNLLSNSLRYAQSEISLSAVEDKNEIQIKVSNDGARIPPEQILHIFERFYKGNGGIHGIGLAIVKAIVEQQNGRVEVMSDDKETSFILIFPKG